MSVQAPPRSLVENYLVEIGKSHNVPYEPDPSAFLVRNNLDISVVEYSLYSMYMYLSVQLFIHLLSKAAVPSHFCRCGKYTI